MAKFSDKYKTDVEPTSCPFNPHEGSQRRHDRRKATALQQQDDAKQWAESRGFSFRVANHGHHFMFTRPLDPPGKHFAQWWPRSAKLVFWNNYPAGLHVHDIGQVIAEMERVLNDQGRKEHRQPNWWRLYEVNILLSKGSKP